MILQVIVMSGHKRRTTPTTEFTEVVTTATMALTFQRLTAASATFLPTATSATYGSRPTLILMPPSELEEAKECGEEFTEQKTITDSTGAEITIPKGYRVTEDSATLVDDGVVISDAETDGNEWVWVPVEDPSIMYEENPAGVALSGNTGVTTTKYSASGIISGQSRGLPGSASYREPDILYTSGYDDSYYETAGFSSLEEMAQMMVNEYNTMILSIERYGGFYIGRYELTSKGEKSGTTLINKNWYELYAECKDLAKSGSNATSLMIWGAQWDVTCNWLANNGYNMTNSNSWGNYADSTGDAEKGSGIKHYTGYSEYWKANNIYDFAGNCYEWTQEVQGGNAKAMRSGSYVDYGYSPSLKESEDAQTSSDVLRYPCYFNHKPTT